MRLLEAARPKTTVKVILERGRSAIRIGSAWAIGGLALYWALSPPEPISEFYTADVGLLSGNLFVPTVAGLWWKRANLPGGVSAVVAGAVAYVLVHFEVIDFDLAPIVGGLIGPAETPEMLDRIESLHSNS